MRLLNFAARVAFFAFLSVVVLAGGAQAQTQRKFNLPIDPLNLNGTTLTGDIKVDMKALWEKLVKSSTDDLKYASAMAGAAGTPSSKQRKQCWDAIIVINQQVSGEVKDSAGAVMAKPNPSAFTDIESQAEVLDNLSPQGTLFTSCAGAAEMAKMQVLQFVNAVVTGAAGLAAGGVAIP